MHSTTRIVVVRTVKSVTGCASCHFAAAVRCEAGAFSVGFTQRPLRPPYCGSKMTAGAIVKHPTYNFIQLLHGGSKKKAEAIGDRPVKPRLPLLIRSHARKCGTRPAPVRIPGAGIPAKALAGTRRKLSFPPCKAHFLSAKENGGCTPVPPRGAEHVPAPGRRDPPVLLWGGLT